MSARILHLSAADVEAAAPDAGNARHAILEAFRAIHAGRATSPPKQVLGTGGAVSFQSRMATWREKGVAAIKWLGIAPMPPGSAAPGIHATIILSDCESGRPLAVMDGNVLTGLRTAAMSAAAAVKLARPDPRRLGVIGCGLQARTHLTALKAALPSLRDLVAYSRSPASAAALVARARDAGWRGECVTMPEAAVRDCDVVVTTVPMSPGFEPFLDADWVAQGAFVTAVDIARSWHPHTLRSFDILVTDSHAQMAENPPLAPGLGPLGSFDAELAELAAEIHPGRRDARQRAMFVFRGLGLADLAIALEIYRSACAQGIGTRLSA